MEKPIVNIDQLEFTPWGHGDLFQAQHARVGDRLRSQKLGYTVTVVPPGKRAFPLHNHRLNEEMFFILEGEGELRLRGERHPVKRGDFIACPPGGPETAHQSINTHPRAELRYLAVSTKLSAEVCDYPDSGKIGVACEVPGPDGKPQLLRFLTRAGESLDYWEGNK